MPQQFWDWSDVTHQVDDTRLTIAGVFWLTLLAAVCVVFVATLELPHQ